MSGEMRAVTLTGTGGPEVMQVSTLPIPRPGPGQVLIAVQAAGVNRPDISQRQGRYPVPADASPIPGLEVAGTIAALGDGVEGFIPEQPVCALVHGGGYATHALADAGTTLPLPAPLSMIEAAALPEVALTVEFNVVQRAGLQAGDWVLIHGGSSGIGSHAVERARALGARVIVTAGSDQKCGYCTGLGAEAAINYKTTDFVQAVRDVTGGHGADVVLDMVGGPYVTRNLQALADDGRYAVISLQGGREITADFEPLLRRRLSIIGSTLRPLPPARKAALARDVVRDVWPLIAAGKIRPQIYQSFPLDRVADAHRLMESGAHQGKIVLTMG
ncbi:NAD(P)H-quinone oxidoreductase [Actibacterium sp.]|uniref:NAD(P)H-quinone oxidoreductase n=1 Tax=Actibacterium sp. TaxID=1872125 RepID=UPI0035646534